MARRFLEAASRSPQDTLVALDFDGTLSDMVEDPTKAYVNPDARRALVDLTRRIGHVAIITGRPVDEVQRLGGLDDELLASLVVMGQYGAERLDQHGRHVPDAPRAVRDAIAELETLVDHFPGLYIEDKFHAVGVHTRRAERGTMEKIEDDVVAVARRYGLDIEPGREVLELRAHKGSKGDALKVLINEFGAEAVAMVGDDLGDVPAFDVVAQRQQEGLPGVVVVSSSDERPELAERADVLCDGPAGVARWLDVVGAPRS